MGNKTRWLLDRSSDLNPRNMRLGMYAWVMQRLSGVYLVFFLLAHITAIAQANFGVTKGLQATILDALRNSFTAGGLSTTLFDLIALGIIAFHGLNGIRIVFLDLGFGVRAHRLSFWLFMAMAIAVSGYVIMLGLPMLAKAT